MGPYLEFAADALQLIVDDVWRFAELLPDFLVAHSHRDQSCDDYLGWSEHEQTRSLVCKTGSQYRRYETPHKFSEIAMLVPPPRTVLFPGVDADHPKSVSFMLETNCWLSPHSGR